MVEVIPSPDSGGFGYSAVNPVTGDFCLAGRDLVVWQAPSGSKSVVEHLLQTTANLDIAISNNTIIVRCPELHPGNSKICVYGIDGRCVYSSDAIKQPSQTIVGPLSEGIYFIALVNERGERTALKKVSVF